MAHGRGDPVVQIGRAEASRELLKELGHPIDWREYMMPHSVCEEEIDDIGAWMRRQLTV